MNLEQQKKQARELLRGIRAGEATALARLRAQQERWGARGDGEVCQAATLMDAQFTVAREQGFSSWTKLRAYADPNWELSYTKIFVADEKWIHERVFGLLETRASGGPAALEQIRNWHPRFQGARDEEILSAAFGGEDAQLVYAREHGFESWTELAQRVAVLAKGGAVLASEPFLEAFRAMEAADAVRFRDLLLRHKSVARQRGTNGNSLMNLCVSLAPKLGLAMATGMLEELQRAGADVNEANDRGWTPLHQAGYGNQKEVGELLLGWGADAELEAHGSGGTPVVVALFWGHRDTAAILSRVSLAPRNLRVAAGLGRLDLMEECFDGNGVLRVEAGAARGFYRPHSGFPKWQPADSQQEVLDEALVWAAKSGEILAMERLLRAGARLDGDPYRGTALIWAAFCNRVEAAEWLIAQGAQVNLKATFGGLTHGQGITALHLAAQNGHLEMVKVLVANGADPTVREDLYKSDAAGAAKFFGQEAVWGYLSKA